MESSSPELSELLEGIFSKVAGEERVRIESGVDRVALRLKQVIHGLPSRTVRSEQIASKEQTDLVTEQTAKIWGWLLKNGRPGSTEEEGFHGKNYNCDDNNFGVTACEEADDHYLVFDHHRVGDENGSSISISMKSANEIAITINFSKRSPIGYLPNYESGQRPIDSITPEEAQITTTVFDKFIQMKAIE